MSSKARLCAAVVVNLGLLAGGVSGQGLGRGGAPGPPRTAKAAALYDITGYWVSVVTEDWRWRMVTPLKGDAASVPTSAAARPVIDAWDPAKDEAAGLQYKSYGAAAIMRVPGRLHITWQDDRTLKIDTDAGQQVRLLHFAGEPERGAAPSWQGYSTATWQGDTLVITSKGFRDDIWIDWNGSVITEAATVTERIRRPDYGHLEIGVTVDDPKAYTKPWTVTLRQQIALNTELVDEICLENEKFAQRIK